MSTSCYYTQITIDNINRLTQFITFLKKEILSKSCEIGDLRFVSGALEHCELGKYLVLYTNPNIPKSLIFSMWTKDPSRTFQHNTYLCVSKLLKSIAEAANKSLTQNIRLKSREKELLCILTQYINNINTINNESKLQREKTSRYLGSERVGTSVRYSGNKFTVAVGYLSNKARTSQV